MNNPKFTVNFSSADTTNSLALELRCTSAQAEIFVSTNQLSSFAVVFKCRGVKRLRGDQNIFLVKGELVDGVQLTEHFESQDASSQGAEPDPYEPD